MLFSWLCRRVFSVERVRTGPDIGRLTNAQSICFAVGGLFCNSIHMDMGCSCPTQFNHAISAGLSQKGRQIDAQITQRGEMGPLLGIASLTNFRLEFRFKAALFSHKDLLG